MAHNIKKIKTGEFGIKVPFSRTCRVQDISQNHNVYLHQRKITLPGLLWDTLYIEKKMKSKMTELFGMICKIKFWNLKKIGKFLETCPLPDYHFQSLRYWRTRAKKAVWNYGVFNFPKNQTKNTINCLTASIFESGPMPTPWKFLDSLPVIPSC